MPTHLSNRGWSADMIAAIEHIGVEPTVEAVADFLAESEAHPEVFGYAIRRMRRFLKRRKRGKLKWWQRRL